VVARRIELDSQFAAGLVVETRPRQGDHALVKQLIDTIGRASIAVVGDFFLDEYVNCRVKGVSPEMPVLRVVAGSTSRAPGAAGNLAANFQALGARVSCVGIIGDDDRGASIVSSLTDLGIDTRGLVRSKELETTTVTRFTTGTNNKQHHHLRVDSGGQKPPEEKVLDEMLARLRHVVADVQAVFIADYDESLEHSLLSDENIRAILSICRETGVMVFGTSRSRPSVLAGVDALLCNEGEAALLGITGLAVPDSETEADARTATAKFGIKTLCITRGSAGAFCVSENRSFPLAPRQSRQVDPCGAGDSFAAAFSLSLVAGAKIDEAGGLATLAGGLAVERSGTVPISTSDLLLGLAPSSKGRAKFVPLTELVDRLPDLRAGRRVVFTNGCFDVFHSGHVQFLRQARDLGDLLIVALNSDRSTEANKGPGRPVIPASERVEIVSGLESVDIVTIFDELTPVGIIDALEPDILVKGGNYSVEDVVGKALVESKGGEVVVIPESGSFATSDFMIAVSSASPGTRDS
jgi:D-beta-D-heptose 7-phosphate kinase/D-beta-D-heptose 1-phosphate adenosyltransferase